MSSLCTSSAPVALWNFHNNNNNNHSVGTNQPSYHQCSNCQVRQPNGSNLSGCTFCGGILIAAPPPPPQLTAQTTSSSFSSGLLNSNNNNNNNNNSMTSSFIHTKSRLEGGATIPTINNNSTASPYLDQVGIPPSPPPSPPPPLPRMENTTQKPMSSKRSTSEVIDLSNDDDGNDDNDKDEDGDRKMPATKKQRRSDGSFLDDMDMEVALQWQAQEIEQRKQQEQNAMLLSNTGRAFKLVETLIQMHRNIMSNEEAAAGLQDVELVGQDDIVFLTERFLECQQKFAAAYKPTHVCLAYHYTNESHLHSIRQDGLLSHPERQSKSINARRAAHFGDGVYTACNPYAFRHFGNTGLLCAILKGQEARVGPGGSHDPNVNTAIGNKKHMGSPFTDEIVLRECCQVLPILRFSSGVVELSGSLTHNGNALLWKFHVEVQKILDQFFNGNQPTEVERVTPQINNQTSPTQALTAAIHQLTNQSLFSMTNQGIGTSQMHRSQQQNTSQLSQAATPFGSNNKREEEMRRQKERFLMFTRVLMKYLETKDPALHQKVKAIIKDCAERNKRQEKGYESVTESMRERLKHVVADAYWKRAESYLAHFLAQKQKCNTATAPAAAHPQQATAAKSSFAQAQQQRASFAGLPAAGSTSQITKHSSLPVQAATNHQQQAAASVQKGSSVPNQGTMNHSTATPYATSSLKAYQNGLFSNPQLPPAGLTGTAATALPVSQRPTQPPTTAAPSPVANPLVQREALSYVAPASLITADECCHRVRTLSKLEDCPICFTKLHRKGRVLQLYSCGHLFHSDCISAALQHDSKCPKCRAPVSKDPRGKCPSGTMTISHTLSLCGGFADSNGSIMMTYNFPSGTQLPYHETPGKPYSANRRVAYLPNNAAGRDLLKRFKYAWSKGLLFSVGTSLTTGKSGQIVWSSVHQKSTMHGGAHGFPDPNYFANANAELDALGVPSHEKINN